MLSDVERDPSLSELLDDPVARAVMRRDGVDPTDVRELIREMRLRLTSARGAPRRNHDRARPSGASRGA